MALFYMDHSSQDKPLDQFSQNCARRLVEGLTKNRKLMRPPSMPNWTNEFQKLQFARTPEDIQRVLSWYLENMNKEYLPQAYSARSFRDNFELIAVKMLESGSGVSIQDQEDPCVSYAVRKLQDEPWPRGFRELLPQAAVLSMRAYRPTFARFCDMERKAQEAYDDLEKQGRMNTRVQRPLRLLNLLASQLFLHPRYFLVEWFQNLHEDVRRWSEWRGPVRNAVFHLDSDRLTRMAQRLLCDFTGHESDWPEILKQLKESP